ncbi:MAG: Hpt domain-containing protein [Proteobacteria bacterium]|nr:Hpt domain-containing protein [Pseudomonadota bacterium]
MTTAKPGKPQPRVRLFRRRNRLAAKVGVGGGPAAEPGKLSEEAFERAMKEIEKAAEDYPDWVRESLDELGAELKAAWDLPPEERVQPFRKIGRIAHELKGQGGTFGYPLISTFGDMLYEFTQTDVKIRDNLLEVAKAHLDVMRAVINDRVSGKGGSIGQDLKLSLDQAIKKYSGE